jgi:DNA polymerase III alpha subunit
MFGFVIIRTEKSFIHRNEDIQQGNKMGQIIYQNYHRHSNYSIVVAGGDSVVKNEEYAKRAIELGHGIISGVEHGFQGRHIEGYELSKKYNLKFLFGSEAYWVKDRKEKDRKNNHIVVLAKNERGRKAINVALAEAFTSGYYYVPRLDLELLFQLPSNDVWITSACIGGWKYDDADDLWLKIAEHFGKNFFLEVQNHNTDSQKLHNRRVLDLATRNNIELIFGCDSHYIFPSQSTDREQYLLSKGIVYEDESGWFMDYPDGDTVYQRFLDQGVLSKAEIDHSIENTNVFLDVEEYHSPVYSNEIKVPTLYPDKTKEEKDAIYENLIWSKWNEEKKNIEHHLWKKYEDEIKKEVQVVKNINHADYFLLDYEIVKKGKEKGGIITSTGRGSGVSYYTCKLLDLTKIDRISSPVHLYPERFLSETRILETKSLADLDLNLANPEVFAEAQKEILGQDGSYPMIAWGTMRAKEAWKMYSRANHVDFETANDVSGQIDEYEFALKHLEDDEDKESVYVEDYIDNKYVDLVTQSSRYLGIYSNVKIHPCAYLLADFNIREEAGIIAMKTAKGKVNICTLIDGLWAEKYKMLKNDLLKVNVVDLYSRVYKRIGMNDTHDVNELWKITKNDSKTWDIYKKGIVMGINQVEQSGTARRTIKYAPSNISELSALVAAVRPGFASMYDIFESREPFSYDIPSFDNIIQTEEMKNSFVLYQEQSMAALAFAGIPMTETYEIIKSIAKKRYDKVFKYKEQFVLGFSNNIKKKEKKSAEESLEIANSVWKILEDSSRYSFNASHSLSVATDSLYTAYLKAYYPIFFYEQFLQLLEEKGEKDRLLKAKAEAETFFKISFPQMRFGQDNRNIVANPDQNEITMSMNMIKGFGHEIAENLYELNEEFSGNSIVDLFILASDLGKFSASKWEKLLLVGYFSDFGNGEKVHNFFKEFTKGEFRYNPKHKDKTKEQRIQKLYKIWESLENNDFSIADKIHNEIEIVGEVRTRFPVDKKCLLVMEVDEKYAPRILFHSLATGKSETIKISKKKYNGLKFGDIVYCSEFEKKPAVKKVNGQWIKKPNEFNWWAESYYIVDDIRKFIRQ